MAGVGVVRNHVVAPGPGRLDADLRYRRRFVRADELGLNDCDAQPAVCERVGAVLS